MIVFDFSFYCGVSLAAIYFLTSKQKGTVKRGNGKKARKTNERKYLRREILKGNSKERRKLGEGNRRNEKRKPDHVILLVIESY